MLRGQSALFRPDSIDRLDMNMRILIDAIRMLPRRRETGGEAVGGISGSPANVLDDAESESNGERSVGVASEEDIS
jgi:hypothetical protein